MEPRHAEVLERELCSRSPLDSALRQHLDLKDTSSLPGDARSLRASRGYGFFQAVIDFSSSMISFSLWSRLA